MRVFLAVTSGDIRELLASGRVGSALVGYAATEHLDARLGLDGEERDLALSTAAAELSADMAQEAGFTVARRIVLVADVPDVDVVVESPDDGEVRVPAGLVRRHVASVLADVEPVDLATVVEADGLAWFATQELDDLG